MTGGAGFSDEAQLARRRQRGGPPGDAPPHVLGCWNRQIGEDDPLRGGEDSTLGGEGMTARGDGEGGVAAHQNMDIPRRSRRINDPT